MIKSILLDLVAIAGICLQSAGIWYGFGWHWAAIIAGSELVALGILGTLRSAT